MDFDRTSPNQKLSKSIRALKKFWFLKAWKALRFMPIWIGSLITHFGSVGRLVWPPKWSVLNTESILLKWPECTVCYLIFKGYLCPLNLFPCHLCILRLDCSICCPFVCLFIRIDGLQKASYFWNLSLPLSLHRTQSIHMLTYTPIMPFLNSNSPLSCMPFLQYCMYLPSTLQYTHHLNLPIFQTPNLNNSSRNWPLINLLSTQLPSIPWNWSYSTFFPQYVKRTPQH